MKAPLKENPLDKLILIAPAVRRDRRLQEGELELIEDAKARKSPLILPIILFAIETGMRRSEILNMQWRHIFADVDASTGEIGTQNDLGLPVMIAPGQ
ncbi:hypothetical protein JDN41_10210 [Rhodomicrobium udaipurense]|uniref:Tyr recombinase domain-containing protein n=1 Tax=Rhodomicrobium udaipurense TaxID=1202716 RepID=A0A8I1GI09_9HYPH|nr:hypothetical protein [Rhodomicrobium udaipurense]MBJ7543935.1 hypothetical protein [Rhodomicrobium udaipurense]